MGTHSSVESLCKSVYDETSKFHAEHTPFINGKDLGYRIMYGPPIFKPEYLFLAYQPGGGIESVREDQLKSWPATFEYAENTTILRERGWENPKLVRNVQKIWSVPILRKSTALNAIFFRARSGEWEKIDVGIRSVLERFSLYNCKKLIEAMQPKRLVCIGFKTFELISQSNQMRTIIYRDNGDGLLKEGDAWGRSWYITTHLSNTRGLKNSELDKLRVFSNNLAR